MSRFVVVSGFSDLQQSKSAALSAVEHFPGPYVSASTDRFFGVATNTGEQTIASHKSGHLFVDGFVWTEMRQKTDAEEILQRILRHGFSKAIASVNGDFACTWLESDSNTLFLARDRFGKRPLYYCELASGSYAVASQPGALLRIAGVSREINVDFAIRYGTMHYRMIDNDLETSPYQSIHQVAPGQIVLLRPESLVVKSQFWRIAEQPEFSEANRSELAEEYRQLLHTSVQSRLRRLSRPVFTLSGGMDSSSVLACAVSLTGTKQPAVSSVYEDSTYDERYEISDMLESHVSEWSQVEVPNQLDLVTEVDKLIRLHDEPVATATWLSHMLVCQKMSRAGFTAVLGGLGGDELNVGEYEYFPFYFADLAVAKEDVVLEREIADWARLHDHHVFKKSSQVARDLMSTMTDHKTPGRNVVDPLRIFRYRDVVRKDVVYPTEFTPIIETVFRSYLKNRMWQDLSRETLPCCLRAEDRHGTGFGLTPVTPFLDNALVDFMFRVPNSLNIHRGVTKQLLREAMRGLLPEKTRTRVKKTGWNAPAHVWFTKQGAQDLRDLVDSNEFRQLGIYDADKVKQVIDDHENIVLNNSSIENHMMFLWSLLNMLRWRKWLNAL